MPNTENFAAFESFLDSALTDSIPATEPAQEDNFAAFESFINESLAEFESTDDNTTCIATEGIVAFMQQKAAASKDQKQYTNIVKTADAMKAAKAIFNVAKGNYSKYGYQLSNTDSAKTQMQTLIDGYNKNPGKVNPTVSKLVTLGGVHCIVVSHKEGKFAQLVIPVSKNGKETQDVITAAAGAKILGEKAKALESVVDVDDDLTAAIESLLCPDCVSKLLAQVKSNVETKCKTAEDCDAMMEKVKQEAVKFNDCLGKMAEAAKGFKAGSVSKDELANVINPCITELRQSCDVLKLGEDCVDDSQDVSDDDIANLRAFIIGTRDIIAKRKEELDTPENAPKDQTDGETVKDAPNDEDDASKANLSDVDSDKAEAAQEDVADVLLESIVPELEDASYDIADEGNISFILRQKFGFDAKETKAVIKEAKAKAKVKDYAGAITLYKKAKSMYENTLKKIEKIPDKEVAMAYRKSKDQYVTDPITKTAAVNSFKNKIFKMENAIDKLEQARKSATKKATESFDICDELDVNITLEAALEKVEDDEDETLDDILDDATDEVTDNDHVKSDPAPDAKATECDK